MNDTKIQAVASIVCELVRSQPDIVRVMADDDGKEQYEKGISNLIRQVAQAIDEADQNPLTRGR